MTRRRIVAVIFTACLSLPLLGAAPAFGHESEEHSYRYICGCAMASGCRLSWGQPGSCPCGKPLLKKVVVREDDRFYYVTRSAEPSCDCAHAPSKSNNCSHDDDLYALTKPGPADCDCFTNKPCSLRE